MNLILVELSHMKQIFEYNFAEEKGLHCRHRLIVS